MYKCEICSVCFDEPRRIHSSFGDGEVTRDYWSEVCPICGDHYFAKAEWCENCHGGTRFSDEKLCKACRKDLLSRINAFMDELTYSEVQQFDDWMDGYSLEDRKKWR